MFLEFSGWGLGSWSQPAHAASYQGIWRVGHEMPPAPPVAVDWRTGFAIAFAEDFSVPRSACKFVLAAKLLCCACLGYRKTLPAFAPCSHVVSHPALPDRHSCVCLPSQGRLISTTTSSCSHQSPCLQQFCSLRSLVAQPTLS